MPEIYLDIEHNIPQQEFFKFKELSELMNKSVKDTIEICMYERRDELLDSFKNNVPDTDSGDNNESSNKLGKRTLEDNVSENNKDRVL